MNLLKMLTVNYCIKLPVYFQLYKQMQQQWLQNQLSYANHTGLTEATYEADNCSRIVKEDLNSVDQNLEEKTKWKIQITYKISYTTIIQNLNIYKKKPL